MTLTVEETITIIKEAAEERDALDKRHDHRAASMMALLANCHRDKKRKAFKPSDFLPQEEETPEQETARVMAEMARLT